MAFKGGASDTLPGSPDTQDREHGEPPIATAEEDGIGSRTVQHG
jgi:hypothetical protein